MGKIFNTTGVCRPDKHYMVNLDERLGKIEALVDQGAYFTINRARQYGKTTTLHLLRRWLSDRYTVFSVSFEGIEKEVYIGVVPFCQRICRLLYGEVQRKIIGGVSDKLIVQLEQMCHGETNLADFPELKKMIYAILFQGEKIPYNVYHYAINVGCMFGFIKNHQGMVEVANRIFETLLYNLFLSEALLDSKIYKAAALDKNQFIQDGQLDMELVLERFVVSFKKIYGDAEEAFVEENGRGFFLLYLKPIINGVGNYYIEARTRDMRRTDVIVDYRGSQYVCELKIWHGQEYHQWGEQQLIGYLDDYHLTKGYMVSFNFNKKKQVGVKKIEIGGRVIVEAVV